MRCGTNLPRAFRRYDGSKRSLTAAYAQTVWSEGIDRKSSARRIVVTRYDEDIWQYNYMLLTGKPTPSA